MLTDRAWERLMVELSDIAAKFGAAIYPFDNRIVLSAAGPGASGHPIPGIQVDWFDDDSVQVQTGWCIEHLLGYAEPAPDGTTDAGRFVDAVCSGGATEYAILGPDGDWRDVEWEVRDDGGNRWARGYFDQSQRRAARTIPRWA